MITIIEAKDLNTLSLESIITNLQSHGMKLNRDEHVRKSKPMDLKSIAKFFMAPQVWEFE